jgi:hypothetical protein
MTTNIQNREFKIKVLTHYGNNKLACVKCGENHLACLSIDHINGGGEIDRQGAMGKGGHTFYRRLIKRGYPAGFQTLCMNCQFIKREERREYACSKKIEKVKSLFTSQGIEQLNFSL